MKGKLTEKEEAKNRDIFQYFHLSPPEPYSNKELIALFYILFIFSKKNQIKRLFIKEEDISPKPDLSNIINQEGKKCEKASALFELY